MSQDEPVAKTEKAPGIAKTAGLVGSLTTISKGFGFLRDVVVLQAIGTSLIADAFNYATLLSGNILVLFGGLGGPFHQAATSVLGKRKGDDPNLGTLIGQLFLFTFIAMSAIALTVWAFCPQIMQAVLNGAEYLSKTPHSAEYQANLLSETVAQLRIMVPLITISGLLGLACGVSNAHNKNFAPSLAPIMASLSIIVAVVVFKYNHVPDEQAGVYLAIGALVGAIMQLAVQLPEMFQLKLKWGLSLTPQSGLKNYCDMLFPLALGTSIGQLMVYTDAFFCMQLQEGAWTAVMNANRLIQLPLGVLLIGILVPLINRFNELLKSDREDRVDELKDIFRRSLRMIWFLTIPMAAILIAIPSPIVQFLFERGKFDITSREMFVVVLLFSAPGMFFYVTRDMAGRVFYAFEDSKTPLYIGIISLCLVKPLANYLLIGPLGLGGIALSTTIVTLFNLSLLWFFLVRKIGHVGTKSLIRPACIMLLAAGAEGATAYLVYSKVAQVISPNIAMLPFGILPMLGIEIGIACVGGFLVYVAICFSFKLEETQMVLKLLKRFARLKS